MTAVRLEPRSRRSGRSRRRLPASPTRFAAVRLRLPEMKGAMPVAGRVKRLRAAGILAAFALGATLLWMTRRTEAPPPREELFVIEEAAPAPPPPLRDPEPPKARPEPAAAVAPPPQFGLKEDALSDHGELAVATGNTLMAEADTVVKAPVAELPSAPPLLDQAPRILRGRSPVYPERAQERGIEGTVVVLITIDTLGRVTDTKVEKSAGRELDAEVLSAVRTLVFQPPVRNGRRESVRFRRPYEFSLQ